MKNSLEKLLEVAKLHTESQKDNKTSCSYRDLFDFLEDGARIIRFNVKEIGGNYVTEVAYNGYVFQAVEREPFNAINSLPTQFSEN